MNISICSSTTIAFVMYIFMGIFTVVDIENENVQPYMKSSYETIRIVFFRKRQKFLNINVFHSQFSFSHSI